MAHRIIAWAWCSSYEIDENTYEQAKRNLQEHNSLTLIHGNGLEAPKSKYDRIIISAGLPNTIEEKSYVLNKIQEQLCAEGIFVGTHQKGYGPLLEPLFSCVIGSKKTGTLNTRGPRMCPVPTIVGSRTAEFSEQEKEKYTQQLTQGTA